MKNHLIRIWTMALLTAAVLISCTNDPKIENVSRIGIRQESLNVNGAGGNVVLNITSNAYWHIEFTDPSTSEIVRWLSVSEINGMGDAEVIISVSRNRSSDSRTASVNVITDSESDSAFILLTQDAGTMGGGEGYSFPFYQMYGINTNLELANASIIGAGCYFDDGMVLRRTGSSTTMEFSTKTHTNPTTNWYFQRGVIIGSWETDDALELEIPLKEELSGDLRYTYGSRRDGTQNAAHAWIFEWSGDHENWTKFDGTCVGGESDPVWKTIDFTIPTAKKIPAGGRLWIRHRCTDGANASTSASNPTVAYQTGFCITKASAEPTTVPAMDTETVVFSTGFDDLLNTKAAYIDMPLDFMSSWNAGTYSLPVSLASIVDLTECYSRPGFLQIGKGDEALISNYRQGSYTIKLASRFETMRILKSDLKLTFMASAMIDAYGEPTEPGVVVKVDALSGATVDNVGKVEGVANNEFKEFTINVRNATPQTAIIITSADMATTRDDVRFFLDDIVIRIEGEPVRPSDEDPIKSSVAEVRSKKGASAVTIVDNVFIQGRVAAVDNVPSGYFAMQDSGAGIFVNMPGHTFATGDLVEIIVNDALLDTDSDGLLVVTPTAADKATKVNTASELPAPRSVTVAELKAGTYEAMLVTLPESQVITADLGKTMSGNVTLELKDQTTTYEMKTYASASFAGVDVPQKRGVVSGLAGAIFLLPASLADLASMTSARFGDIVYAITPIDGHLYALGTANNFTISNATFDQATQTITYMDGHSITKVGNTAANCIFGVVSGGNPAANMYDARLHVTGWGGDNWEDNGFVFKIKATSVLKGNLRFGFGWFAGSTSLVPKRWKLFWSTDNITWHEGAKVINISATLTNVSDDPGTEIFETTGSANDGGYRLAYFSMPDNITVPEGNYLYLKIAQADNVGQTTTQVVTATAEMVYINGFYLTSHDKGAYHTTELPSGANVILSEGFDVCFWGPDYFAGSWQATFAGHRIATNSVPAGWTKSGGIYEHPGYIRMGNSATDAASSLTTPALEVLGDIPTDITVSFKAAGLLVGAAGLVPDNRTIKVTASVGTVGSEVYLPSTLSGSAATVTPEISDRMCDEYLRWYDCSVKIAGATKDSKITFTGTGRHFFDEIVITKD